MNTKTVTLKHGLKIGGAVHKDIELRLPTLGDMMEAENDAPASAGITFRAALIAQVAVRAGSFHGPFTLDMFSPLSVPDFNLLVDGLKALEAEGEGDGSDS
ncbi:hypothetical protein CEK28_04870 [Xenophilus sp. AP218F]|nr:hypothetical protein CEK28_04870 [Xenophilus sp. AP218F]